MKTTVDIPDTLLKQVMKYTGAKTKREAIIVAIEEYNRRRRLAEIANMLGTFRDFMTQEDLRGIREDE